MLQTQTSSRRAWKRRALSLLLAAVMVLGLFPAFPAAEASAHWADPYLSQLMEWGVISQAQSQNPDRALTRADFMGIVNRAYGYHEPGETPFEDIKETDWFYDDVGIAYNARYIKGTSPTTASPNDPLTRETATTILGRNMMLQESAGEILDFTDARRISTWAQGTIKSSLEHYLVSGYDDGTFRPQRNVSWGEMASMVTRLIGTPLQEPGDYSLGGTFGNVTITSPGVTLRDTVVSGDLYITGGVGLGGIQLENVTVLGRIIASGTGTSEGGASILLRNVTADELLVDNLQDNEVSLQADGITEIGRTIVRTSAYIEDNTPEGMGLHMISLEGETYPEGEEPEDWEPPKLTLAGRIEEVVNRTPGSTVHVGSGTVAKLTVDEAAVDSNVIIDRGAVVNELVLDTGVEVTGEGDIKKLVVNAPDCVVEMLPDEIEIRPGITAEIAGEEMDTVAAKESSEEPRILAGYPQAQDVVPTGLDAAFMTNKAGTVYWAVSAITDGSVGEEDLIKPPSYGSIAVKNGSVKVAQGNEETISKVTGLTPGGSYYLSAVLVDARDRRSPVKVISFTTPDNTVPAFCAGYPKMSSIGTGRNPNPDDDENPGVSQVVVMPNKDCKLYYALLPEGAAAPTEAELKSGSVSGALGYGVRDVKKNTESIFRVHDRTLEEETTYVLYLWLTDADGINKGKIVPLKFTTADETPPEFITTPYASRTQAKAVTMTFRLNEDGVVYWVAVPSGTRYPLPQKNEPGTTEPLTSPYAKQQVASGMNLGSKGKAGKVNAKENADGTFNISGLEPETPYDVYYLAQDKAGNYSITVGKTTITPLDNTPPHFTQSFSNTDNSNDKTKDPLATTDIYIDISENVQYKGDDGQGAGRGFVELYDDINKATGEAKVQAIDRLAADLYNSIRLKKYDPQSSNRELTTDTDYKYANGQTFTDSMLVDYTQVRIQDNRVQGKGIRVIFPNSGLHLETGGRYCFEISGLYDIAASSDRTELRQEPDPINFLLGQKGEGHSVDYFDVEFAKVLLTIPSLGAARPIARDKDGNIPADEDDRTTVPRDTSIAFSMQGKSTASVSDDMCYDTLIWTDANITYDLYYRVVDKDGGSLLNADGEYPASITVGGEAVSKSQYLLPNTTSNTVDANGWMIFSKSSGPLDPGLPDENGNKKWNGKTVNQFFAGCSDTTLPKLKQLNDGLRYDFVVHLRSKDGISDDAYTTWKNDVNFRVNVAAGSADGLTRYLSSEIVLPKQWEDAQAMKRQRGAESIGEFLLENGSYSDTLTDFLPFRVTSIPYFTDYTPEFKPADINDDNIKIQLNISSAGTVHYVIAPAGSYDSVNGPGDQPLIKTFREITEDDYQVKLDGNGQPVLDADGNQVKELKAGVQQVEGHDDWMYVTLSGPNPPSEGGTAAIPDWMTGVSTGTDDLLYNKLKAPDRDDFTKTDPWPEGSVSGTFEIEDNRGKQGYPVEGLEPNTDYFAYFIITPGTGENNLASKKSPVYIYHFKTNESAKPRIKLNPQTTTGDMRVDLDVGTETSFLVITETDANDSNKVSILTKNFYQLYSAYTQDTPLDMSPTYKNYTVLQALTTEYSRVLASQNDTLSSNTYYLPTVKTGYSVFDIYANESARAQIYQLITNPIQGLIPPDEESHLTSDDLGPYNTITTERPAPNDEWKQNPLGIEVGSSQYLFLTCAINSNSLGGETPSLDASFSGTIYGKGTLATPEVTKNSTGSLWRTSDGDNPTFEGNLTIRFEPAAYLHQERAVTITTSNLINDDVDCSKSFTPIRTPLGQISFRITNAELNDQVEFPTEYFANRQNWEAKKALLIKLEADPDNEGKARIAVYWGDMEVPIVTIKETAGSSGDDGELRFALGSGDPLRTLRFTLDSETGSTNPPHSNTVTASVLKDDKDWTVDRYTWTEADPSVVSANPKNAATSTITGLKPGKTTVSVIARGYDANDNPCKAENTFEVTVTGKVSIGTSATVTPSTAAQVTLNNGTLGVTKESTSAATVRVPISATGGTLSGSAEYVIRQVSGISRDNVSLNGGSIELTFPSGQSAGTATATIVVGLKERDGTTDLAPGNDDRATLTVNLTVTEPAGTYANRAPQKKPVVPKDLNFTRVSGAALSSGELKLTGSVGSATMSSTIKATITPSGATGTITWKSSNPKVASVTGTGSQAKITGLSAGTATITAAVKGTDISKSIIVTVTSAAINITSFTANDTAKSTVEKEADGYIWTRKVTAPCSATLKFSSSLSMSNANVTVESSAKTAVSVGTVTKNGTTGQVRLTFGSMNQSGEVTITIKVGALSESFKIRLKGGDVVLR